MGAACCKNLDSPVSPKLPICEVLRRCARQMCPLGPSVQKPISRYRKYGLSDIVGPVVKKDSWSQTDPLPPPRRRKKKYKRKRSMSVDFLPYLLKDTMMSSSSLGDITGEEDVIDFKIFFTSRLPENTTITNEDGKDCISGRKKVFLTGLLGEENNNLPALDDIHSLPKNHALSNTGQETAPSPLVEANSRKSSITESLKEFERSLLDMLQDIGEEEEDPKSLSGKESGNQRLLQSQMKAKEVEILPLKEVKEDDYILTPLEEDDEESIWTVNKLTVNKEISHDKNEKSSVATMNENCASRDKENVMEQKSNDNNKPKALSVHEDKQCDKLPTIETPVITVQTVS